MVALQISNLSDATLEMMIEMKKIMQNLQDNSMRVWNTVDGLGGGLYFGVLGSKIISMISWRVLGTKLQLGAS